MDGFVKNTYNNVCSRNPSLIRLFYWLDCILNFLFSNIFLEYKEILWPGVVHFKNKGTTYLFYNVFIFCTKKTIFGKLQVFKVDLIKQGQRGGNAKLVI